MGDVIVTDADRRAAAAYVDADWEYYTDANDRKIFVRATLEGRTDGEELLQAFSRHRTQSTKAQQERIKQLEAENIRLEAFADEVADLLDALTKEKTDAE